MEAWPRVGCSRGIGAPRSRASEAWACRSQGGNRKDDAGDLAGLDAAAADFLPPGDVGAAQDDRDQWKITGSLRRGAERMLLTEPALIEEGGFLLAQGKIARLDDGGAFPWITRLAALKQIPFPDRERDSVMSKLLDLTVVPPLDVDEAL